MERNKMLQANVDETFHATVAAYARENNRSVQQLIRHALKYYMASHPYAGIGEAAGESYEDDSDCTTSGRVR